MAWLYLVENEAIFVRVESFELTVLQVPELVEEQCLPNVVVSGPSESLSLRLVKSWQDAHSILVKEAAGHRLFFFGVAFDGILVEHWHFKVYISRLIVINKMTHTEKRGSW